jgi:hypothetical protein
MKLIFRLSSGYHLSIPGIIYYRVYSKASNENYQNCEYHIVEWASGYCRHSSIHGHHHPDASICGTPHWHQPQFMNLMQNH